MWLLLLNPDGTVKSTLKVSGASFGSQTFGLGISACALGDLDGNGVTELALGEKGGLDDWSTWIVFLGPGATVIDAQEIDETQGGLGAHPYEHFGAALAPLGDLDADGVEDLGVGASMAGGGALFVLRLNADGTVKTRTVLATQFSVLAAGD